MVTRLQEDDASIAYIQSADWTWLSRYKFFSGESAKTAATVGARATLSFTGSGIRWIGQRRPQPSGNPTGIARIYLDGTFIGQVDTEPLLQEEDQAVLFSATGLGSGSHTLTVEVAGRNGEPIGASVDPVVIDAFEVMR